MPDGATTEAREAARAKAQKLLARARGGEDFTQLAIANSEGQQALAGGDLDWRKGANLPTAFARVAPKLAIGDVADIIESGSGFNIIKLTDKRDSGERTTVSETKSQHILLQNNALRDEEACQAQIRELHDRLEKGEEKEKIDEAARTFGMPMGPIELADAVGQLHGRRAAAFRDRDDDVDLESGMVATDLAGEALTHPKARLVDRDAVNDRIRPRQINEFKQAGIQRGIFRALQAVEVAVEVDENRLARRHVANQLEAESVEGDAFRRHHVFRAFGRFDLAEDQRTDAEGIAESEQTVTGNHRHHRIGATAAPVHARDRSKNRRRIQFVVGGIRRQLVRQHVGRPQRNDAERRPRRGTPG